MTIGYNCTGLCCGINETACQEVMRSGYNTSFIILGALLFIAMIYIIIKEKTK